MRNIIIATLAIGTMLNVCAIAQAATKAVKDQTCTRKDGTTYPCSSKMLAFRNDQHECAVKWSTAKNDQAVKDAGWPAYFSDCYKEMKQASK